MPIGIQTFLVFCLVGGSISWGQVSRRSSDISDSFPAEIVRWEPVEDGPFFEGAGGDAWDQRIRERGWILIEDGIYHLWYTGYNPDGTPTKFLGYATCPNGRTWTRFGGNPIFNKS